MTSWNKAIIKPVDQTIEACRSNVGRDLGSIQSMSIVTTQTNLIANVIAVKCQRVEESVWLIWCFAIKQVVKVSEENCLACLIARAANRKSARRQKSVWRPVARTVSKQVLKVLGDRRIPLVYLVICTDWCRNILEFIWSIRCFPWQTAKTAKVLEGAILLIWVKLVCSKTHDLLFAVDLTLWGCNNLIYQTTVLFGLDQNARFWGLLQIKIDQNRLDHLGFTKNTYILRVLQIRWKGTWWQMRLDNEQTKY